MVVGRTNESDITLPDNARRVSRTHAVVLPLAGGAGGGHLLRDLGSLHGTRVNGVPVYQHLLVSGDVIEIGGYRLLYLSESGEQRQMGHLMVGRKKENRHGGMAAL